MTDIKKNLASIQQEISLSCVEHNRNSEDVRLLAVSKTKPAEDIVQAYHAGQKDFGENYLQEALVKIDQLRELPLHWHFIGSIQSNKTRPIAEHFDWVHTIGSLKHARRISEQRPDQLPAINVCIQVNISQENTKSGVSPEESIQLATAISDLKNIKLRGLMAIPAAIEDEAQQRQVFRRLADLKNQINQTGLSLDTLSMGMSGDYHAAIAEGATIIRVGTAIFGKRDKIN